MTYTYRYNLIEARNSFIDIIPNIISILVFYYVYGFNTDARGK